MRAWGVEVLFRSVLRTRLAGQKNLVVAPNILIDSLVRFGKPKF